MKKSAKSYIMSIKPYPPGKPIEEVRRELGLKEIYKLASNENPFGPSPKVFQAMRKASQGVNRYPDGSCFELSRVLTGRMKINSDQIIFGNGSDEIIFMATRAFTGPGDEVIVARPTFLIYEIASRVSGATVRWAPLKDFRYDLTAMKKLVTKRTKIIFIANPDNPTGSYVTKDQIVSFLKGLPDNILVFLDEAYFEYVTAKDFPDSLDLFRRYQNIIFTRTFSKSYGLAGLRVGYGVAHKEIVDILHRVREPFNVNSVAQAAALAALSDRSYYQDIRKVVLAEKERMYQELRKLKLSFVKSATNFILVDVRQSGTDVFKKLLSQGIVVRDMSSWGFDTFIRVTIGKSKENMKFLKILKEIL